MDRDNNIKLLIVDDEEEFAAVSSQALNRRGFEVKIALNGITALEMIDRQKYDAIVLDVKMPDIDGIEVFNHIKKNYPDLPVLLLTGHGSFQDAFKTTRDGVSDYLNKPIEMDELAERIRTAIEKASNVEDKVTEDNILGDDGIRVMLVDDEVEFLDSMKKILQRRKMKVATADGGEKCLTLLNEELVDIVVLDVKMPGMDGLEVLRRIKKQYPSIEVILLSGHPSVDAAMTGIKLGANEYLKKPPDIDELTRIIKKLYEEKRKAIYKQQQRLIEEIRRRYPD